MFLQADGVRGVRASANQPYRVLLVDGHTLYREGLQRLMVAGLPRCQVTAVADLDDLGDPAVADSCQPPGRCGIHCPVDLVLLDLDQRRLNGAAALAEGLRRFSPTPVAVLLDRETAPQVAAISALDPRALIHKTATEAQILAGVKWLLRCAPSGNPHLQGEAIELPRVGSTGGALVVGRPRGAADAHRQAGAARSEPLEFRDDPGPGLDLQSLEELRAELSARQFDVLRLISHGRSNKQISRELGLAESTVKTHVIAIYQKLGVNSRTEATLLASRLGLVSPSPASSG